MEIKELNIFLNVKIVRMFSVLSYEREKNNKKFNEGIADDLDRKLIFWLRARISYKDFFFQYPISEGKKREKQTATVLPCTLYFDLEKNRAARPFAICACI